MFLKDSSLRFMARKQARAHPELCSVSNGTFAGSGSVVMPPCWRSKSLKSYSSLGIPMSHYEV